MLVTKICGEDGTRFASSITFLECELCTQYTASAGSADEARLEIILNQACGQS